MNIIEIKELKKDYDFVGISFIVVTYHKMKEMAALVKKYAPRTKIILGGFGTVLLHQGAARQKQ